MMLSVFLVLLLDLRSAAVCHGLIAQWAHKQACESNEQEKLLAMYFFFFLGLVEGFFVCLFCLVFIWVFFFFVAVLLFKERINIKESPPPPEHLDKF